MCKLELVPPGAEFENTALKTLCVCVCVFNRGRFLSYPAGDCDGEEL